MAAVGFQPPTNQVPTGPCAHAFAIVPSDVTVFSSLTRYIYVGTVGNVSVMHAGDTVAVVYTAVPAGTVLPVCASKVMATGTTASTLVGMY